MGGLIIILATIIPVLLFTRITNIYIVLLIISVLWMGAVLSEELPPEKRETRSSTRTPKASTSSATTRKNRGRMMSRLRFLCFFFFVAMIGPPCIIPGHTPRIGPLCREMRFVWGEKIFRIFAVFSFTDRVSKPHLAAFCLI